MDTSGMKTELVEWLRTQDKEFVDYVVNNDVFGDGHMTVAGLIELDLKFNPEGDNDE